MRQNLGLKPISELLFPGLLYPTDQLLAGGNTKINRHGRERTNEEKVKHKCMETNMIMIDRGSDIKSTIQDLL